MKKPGPDRPARDLWLHATLLAAAIFAAYYKILHAGFMSWDDLDYVFNTRDINSGISIQNIKHWFTQNYLGNYQPLPVFTYALDHFIGGPDPLVFHFHSLLWHFAATLLLYRLFNMVQKNKWISFFVALLFAIHPVQTESVSWIAARNKSMNAVFYFSAMCSYISYVKTSSKRKFALVILFGLLAYICKATALALPTALIALDIWLQRPLNKRRIWFEKLPLVFAGIPIALITLAAQKDVNFLQHHDEFGWSNIVFAGSALSQYVIHLLFPFHLSVLYPYPSVVTFVHVAYFFFALCLIVFMILSFRRGSHIWAGGILFFIVNLLPVLQLVQFGETLMADRYLYIACLGLWFPLVCHLFRLREKKLIAAVISSSVCVIFLVQTFFRNNIWLSEISFWNSVLEKFPESPVAQYSIGAAYMKDGDLERSELHMNLAVKYDPRNYKAWRNKGALHLRQNKINEALDALNKSIGLYPFPKAYFTRAMLYHGIQKFSLAISDAVKVLEQEPNNARAHYLKADCEEQLEKFPEALRDFNNAVNCDASEPLFLIRRGLLYAKTGNMKAALNDIDKAVALKPQEGEPLYYRAIIKYSLNLDPCEDLYKAIRNGYGPANEMLRKICKRS
jgi:tetratricopeptide (TPR) repeat protein